MGLSGSEKVVNPRRSYLFQMSMPAMGLSGSEKVVNPRRSSSADEFSKKLGKMQLSGTDDSDVSDGEKENSRPKAVLVPEQRPKKKMVSSR